MVLTREGKKTLASDMRKRISVQARTLTHDSEGGHAETWTERIEVWAAIYPIKAQQAFEYASINVRASHIIAVRGMVDIRETDRIVYDSRNFEVVTVENIQEQDVVKVCACLERRT